VWEYDDVSQWQNWNGFNCAEIYGIACGLFCHLILSFTRRACFATFNIESPMWILPALSSSAGNPQYQAEAFAFSSRSA
jgi:hypothetical protein